MATKELIHIRITRIVPAARWRVIRMVTKVWEFAAHVPTIQQVEVIEKTRNVMKTKWRILVDGLPINWIEEDTLSLGQDAIHFRAVEGDLEEFKGTWKFLDHPEGTEVILDVYLSVGIPVIKDFAEEYVKTLVTKNFESILETLENRLISTRYTSFKKGNTHKIAGFGLLGHFYNFKHLEKGLKLLNPDYKLPSQEFLGKLFGAVPAFKMYEMNKFVSKTGDTTHGCIILCTFIPDMIVYDINSVYSKVVRACKLAEKSGVGIVTLGGFTSMVGEMLGRQISEDVDIPITTGNTYTTALAIDGVERAVQLLERVWKDLKVTVVGGTGDIGSGCARILAEKAKQVTVTGRTKSNLRSIRGELQKIRKAKIEATTDNKKAVKDADIVIAAANASSSILSFDWFKSGAVICDLGYPKNLSYKATKRKDVFVFSGGLASVPTPIDTGIIMGLPSSKVCYGCSCEAIILALEHRFENYSFGKGNIMPAKVDAIREMALKHGFELAPFFWADKIMECDDIEQVKKATCHA